MPFLLLCMLGSAASAFMAPVLPATPVQDSAASKGTAAASPANLSQQYLDALHESPLVGKTADEVLLEIDGTLAALEQQQQLAGGGGALERAEERVLA